MRTYLFTLLLLLALILSPSIIKAQESVSQNSILLIWEADSYTPPFYKGKALLTNGGASNVVAIPRVFDEFGNHIPSLDLTFGWRFNSRAQQDVSGFGKNVFQNDRSTNDNTISVEVRNINGVLLAKNAIVVPRTKPNLVVYPNDPLRGLLFTDIETMRSAFSKITAVPYFFSNSGSLTYSWESSRGLITGQGNSATLSLQQRSDIRVSAESTSGHSQRATTQVSVN